MEKILLKMMDVVNEVINRTKDHSKRIEALEQLAINRISEREAEIAALLKSY